MPIEAFTGDFLDTLEHDRGKDKKNSQDFSLALGGGGARGLAHIGVVKRLEELGVTPQAIAGTSMGALVGGLLAIGKTSDDMMTILDGFDLPSYTRFAADFSPRYLNSTGENIEKFLDTIFEGKTFEQTNIPFTVIATDLETCDVVRITTGKISEAVRASISLPIIFKPAVIGGRKMIDGGVSNNLPADVLPKGKVIAVSATRNPNYPMPRIRKILVFPWFFDVMRYNKAVTQKTIDTLMSGNEKRSLDVCDDVLFIRAGKNGVLVHQFWKHKQLIEEGYQVSEEIKEYLGV